MQRITESLAGLAVVAARQGRPERVLRLGAAASRLAAGAGTEISLSEQAELDRAMTSARDALGKTAAATASEGETATAAERSN
jgi:hypothetical protein